jgi:acyl-CoA synthetase (AMP-forming)/AMP-acid ligase II
MMTGYHNQRDATAAAEWRDAAGQRFIRTGDVGRFDDDGFIVLLDRRKDVIISGGFNIYPSDLEAVLASHPDVAEAAVVAKPSADWGETPAAFVVARAGRPLAADELKQWANARLGRMQRIAEVRVVEALPRSGAGKVLKRALREAL